MMQMSMLAPLLLLVDCVAAVPAAPGPQLLVDTAQGKLQGFVEQGSRKWLGVPFAEPPVGDKRWRPPEPKKPWGSAARPATEFKPDCAQFGPGWPSLGITNLNTTSEDCLTLNVFSPLATASGGAPVVVFFPAGGYTWGAANDAEMNAFGKSSAPGWQDAVFVTANYRVSIFGFLAHKSLRSRSPSGSTGCYGSQDQREALRWVQQNIAAFGGDPKRVMIFGESAGATSITTHMVMKDSWGLFQRAAADSGGFSDWVRNFDDASDVFENVTASVGCADKPDPVACMVAKPTKDLLDATDPFYGYVNGKHPVLPHPESVLGTQWAPVVDGVEMTATPQALLEQGHVAPGVPMLLGSNRDEGSLFREQTDYLADEEMFDGWLNATLGETLASDVRSQKLYTPETASDGLYKGGNGSVWSTLQSDVLGDLALHCPARRAAGKLKAGAYLYSFEVTPYFTVNFPPGDWLGKLGAFHGAEVPFVLFDTFELTGPEVALGAQMATAWTNFAATGDPNLKFSMGDDDDVDDDDDDESTPLAAAHMDPSGQRRRTQAKSGAVPAVGDAVLPERCSGYHGLSGVPATRLNGTVQQTLHDVSGVGACCKACSHLFYNQLCQGWRFTAGAHLEEEGGGGGGTCELLSGDVGVANSTVSSAAT